MKTYALTITIVLCHCLFVHASIINGFLKEKLMLEKEIKNNVELLKEDTTDKAIRQIEKKLKRLRKEYEKVLTKYSETEQLLSEMKFIDPDLYEKVSKVTNAEGTLTHVFVRYVDCTSKEFTYFSRDYFMAKAYTSVWYSQDNKNVCSSPYGLNTITIGKLCDEKLALGHEFAHVLYIVPNLKAYSDFLKSHDWYKINKNKFSHGHSIYDQSYAFVESVEDSFSIYYRAYLKRIKNQGSFKKKLAESKDK